MAKTVRLGDLDVEIARKPIKHVYLRILPPDGKIAVSAPPAFGEAEIAKFVLSRMGWIRAQREKIGKSAARPEKFPPETQKIWGREAPVVISKVGRKCGIRLENGRVFVTSPEALRPEVWNEMRSCLLRRLVLGAAPDKMAAWSARLGLARVNFEVRRMKSRWGTCYPSRNKILLNSELGAKPPACLDQVIVHELTHFFEQNHGPGFKARMDRFLPDWREIEPLFR